MKNSQADERLDSLAAQVHDWTESAVSLDEGHFPNELLNDLEDLVDELKIYLDEDGTGSDAETVTDLFITPEMAEVIQRFPRVKRMLERAWGTQLMDVIEEEGIGFVSPDDNDDE